MPICDIDVANLIGDGGYTSLLFLMHSAHAAGGGGIPSSFSLKVGFFVMLVDQPLGIMMVYLLNEHK